MNKYKYVFLIRIDDPIEGTPTVDAFMEVPALGGWNYKDYKQAIDAGIMPNYAKIYASVWGMSLRSQINPGAIIDRMFTINTKKPTTREILTEYIQSLSKKDLKEFINKYKVKGLV